jgi:uncharacterized protein YdaT
MSGRNNDLIKECYRNMRLFFDVLENKGQEYLKTQSESDLDELVKILKMQHQSNRYSLEDLGVSFDETGVVRRLNERIRLLEEKFEEGVENSPAVISQYISKISEELSESFLDEFGVGASFDITMGKAMKLKVSLFRVDKELTSVDKMFAKTDQELVERKAKKEADFEKAKSILDIEKSSIGRDYEILYTKENKEKIERFLRNKLSDFGVVSEYKVGLRSSLSKNDKMKYVFSSVDCLILTSQSMQSFHENFNR